MLPKPIDFVNEIRTLQSYRVLRIVVRSFLCCCKYKKSFEIHSIFAVQQLFYECTTKICSINRIMLSDYKLLIFYAALNNINIIRYNININRNYLLDARIAFCGYWMGHRVSCRAIASDTPLKLSWHR